MEPTDQPRKNIRSALVVVSIAAAGVLLVLYAWQLPPFHGTSEVTENAYVRGSITVVAPKVDGYVAEVLVQDYSEVRTGQVIVRLDDRNYVQKLAQAKATLAAQEANLANVVQARLVREAGIQNSSAVLSTALAQKENAEAQLARTRADQRRVESLISDGSVSQRELDQTQGLLRQAEAVGRQTAAGIQQARASAAVAVQELRSVLVNRRAVEAAVEGARAAVALAEIDLDNTLIKAPRDGIVGEVGVKQGQYVSPGTQLMALVPPQVWVVANFKEAQTSNMVVGQSAAVRVDALDGAELRGRIEKLSPATGSEFSVIRADNATGNFTKVPQRLPVRIAILQGQPLAGRLRPGMSVVATVETSQAQK